MFIKKKILKKNSSNNINWLLNEFCTTVNNAGRFFPDTEDTNNACEMKILKSHSQPNMMLDNSADVKRGSLDD